VDAWFDAWGISDTSARDREFTRIAGPDVLFRDRYSCLRGVTELSAHAGASQRFMPGVQLSRKGTVRHCQGTVVASWAASPDGREHMTGINVFRLGSDGRIHDVTGLADIP
jgi:hypothetical protein